MLEPPTPAYVAGLVKALDMATEFRVPCPGHPYGSDGDLRIKRRRDGHDGWAVLNDNHAWAHTVTTEHGPRGTQWVYRGRLARDEIYPYTRDQALAEAIRIAPTETARFNASAGGKQLGTLANAEHGIRRWNLNLLLIGHHDLGETADLLRTIYPGVELHPVGWHHHVHLTELLPPPNYPTEGLDWRGWIFCGPDDTGALPITHFMPKEASCGD